MSKPPTPQDNNMLRNILSQFSDQIFQEFDANKSGRMDSAELKNAVTKVFELADATPPSTQEIYQIVQLYDKNKDRLIDAQEFKAIVFRLNGF